MWLHCLFGRRRSEAIAQAWRDEASGGRKIGTPTHTLPPGLATRASAAIARSTRGRWYSTCSQTTTSNAFDGVFGLPAIRSSATIAA